MEQLAKQEKDWKLSAKWEEVGGKMRSTLVMVDTKRTTVNTMKINRKKMMNTSLEKAPGKFNLGVEKTNFLIL